jgi:hypothetical protein
MEARFWLRLESGPDAGRTIPIPIEGVAVGRKPENGLVLADASVSGKHAELRVGADGVVVRDLGSTNGTFVGPQRVIEHTLAAGDKVRFGTVAVTFYDARAAAPPSASVPSSTGSSSSSSAGSGFGSRPTASDDDEITLESPDADPPAAGKRGTAKPGAGTSAGGTSGAGSSGVGAPRAPKPAAAAALSRTVFQPTGAESPAAGIDSRADELLPAARHAPETPAVRADASQVGEGLGHVSNERLTRVEKRPVALLALAGVLLVGSAGGLVWYRWFRGASGAGAAVVEPKAPAGNLLGGSYSFEGDAAGSGWTGAEAATQTLFPELGAAHSGRGVLAGSFGAGEWALVRSDPVRVQQRQAVVLTAAVRRSGGVEARVGVQLTGVDDAHPPLHAWSSPLVVSADWTPLELKVPVLPGWDRVEVLLAARGGESGGRASFDDVGLVQQSEQAEPLARSGDYQLWTLGDAPTSAVLMRVEQWIVAGLALSDTAGAPDGFPHRAAQLSARDGEGLHVAFGALDGTRELTWIVAANIAKQGLATIGPAGYQSRQREFEPVPTTSVLLGSGYQMVRLSWADALPLGGAPVSGGYRFSGSSNAPFEIALQLSFKDERVLANRAAEAARAAEKGGRHGECMVQWGELLAKWPFEEALVKEAEAARARLSQAGQEAVHSIEAEIERAKFFALEDLYRQCEQKARTIVDRYAGSEIGLLAQQAAERAASAAQAAGNSARVSDVERLRAVRAALPDAPRLSKLLDEEITRLSAGQQVPRSGTRESQAGSTGGY